MTERPHGYALVLTAAVFLSCDKAPVEPVQHKDAPEPLPAVTVPAQDTPAEHVSAASDTHTVSFEGTEIRLMNTSGGTVLGFGKTTIIEVDWNISVKDQDGNQLDLRQMYDDDQPSPVWQMIRLLGLGVYCASGPKSFTHTPNPHFGPQYVENYHLGFRLPGFDVREVMGEIETLRASTLNWVWNDEEGGFVTGGLARGEDIFLGCRDLEARIWFQQGVLYGSTGSTQPPTDVPWVFEENAIPLPEVEYFRPRVVNIIYHPIAPDSATAAIETDRMEAVVLDRHGFVYGINRMMPIHSSLGGFVWDYQGVPGRTYVIGEAVVIAPKIDAPEPRRGGSTRSLFCEEAEDGPLYRAVHVLKETYPVMPNDDDLTLHIGILSYETSKNYCREIQATGYGFIGLPWSVFLRENSPFHGGLQESSTLQHEIGHNLGLPHTQDDPLAPDRINKDAFLVESETRRIIRMRPYWSPALMSTPAWDNAWLSEYNWNRIVDLHGRSDRGNVAARRHAHDHSGDLWVHEGH